MKPDREKASQYSHIMLWIAMIGGPPALYTGFIRPQLVLAEDLAPMLEVVQQIGRSVEANSKAIQGTQIQIYEMRIAYIQNEIIKLNERDRSGALTDGEAFRRDQYANILEDLKRELKRLES